MRSGSRLAPRNPLVGFSRTRSRLVACALIAGLFGTAVGGTLLLAPGARADVPPPLTITLPEVAARVSSANFAVLEEAERVYQARESIRLARASLLPRLNLWGLADAAVGIASAVYGGAWMEAAGMVTRMVEDIAPFLVPANWFRIKESRILYWAERESYRALWANELLGAKGAYLQALMDLSLREEAERQLAILGELVEIARAREVFGAIPQGASRAIELMLLDLEEDLRALAVLVTEESSALAVALGLPGEQKLVLAGVGLPDADSQDQLSVDDLRPRVVDSSPELRQYDRLIEALPWVKKEIRWSFLGMSSASRGVAGGIFDEIPIPEGLGFGTAPALRVARSQEGALLARRRGSEETLLRQLRIAIESRTLGIDSLQAAEHRVALAAKSYDQIRERWLLGDEIEIEALTDSSGVLLQARVARVGTRYRYLLLADRLARLTFSGDYGGAP